MTTFAIVALAAALAADAPKPEIRNVRFSSPSLIVSRAKSGSEAIVTGQFRVDMSFARATAKRPVVRLVAICEENGSLVVHGVFLDRLRTNDAMKRGDIMQAYKNAGVEIPSKEREAAYSDPARFTPLLPEVTKAAYAAPVYGTGEIDRGFFRLGRCATLPKIVAYHIELWQNGVLVASWDSSRTGLGKYGLPADWHVWKKYPQKFKYVDAR